MAALTECGSRDRPVRENRSGRRERAELGNFGFAKSGPPARTRRQRAHALARAAGVAPAADAAGPCPAPLEAPTSPRGAMLVLASVAEACARAVKGAAPDRSPARSRLGGRSRLADVLGAWRQRQDGLGLATGEAEGAPEVDAVPRAAAEGTWCRCAAARRAPSQQTPKPPIAAEMWSRSNNGRPDTRPQVARPRIERPEGGEASLQVSRVATARATRPSGSRPVLPPSAARLSDGGRGARAATTRIRRRA
jgi:hypothetical protein